MHEKYVSKSSLNKLFSQLVINNTQIKTLNYKINQRIIARLTKKHTQK